MKTVDIRVSVVVEDGGTIADALVKTGNVIGSAEQGAERATGTVYMRDKYTRGKWVQVK